MKYQGPESASTGSLSSSLRDFFPPRDCPAQKPAGTTMLVRMGRAMDRTADMLATIGRKGPVLLDRVETLAHALETGCSIARFGDGELGLAFPATGSACRGIHFQAYDRNLSDRLKAILLHPHQKVLVCFNNAFARSAEQSMVLDYEPTSKPYRRLLSIQRSSDVGVFERKQECRSYVRYLRKIQRLGSQELLGDATCFVLGLFFKQYIEGDIAEVCSLYRRFFSGRRVLFVGPKTPLHGASFLSLVEQGIIMSPRETALLTVPDRNCFSHYDYILMEILKHRPLDAVFIQAGPAATVLAADLAVNHGLTAYDVGSFNISLGKAAERHGLTF